jgi:hypothetical protein
VGASSCRASPPASRARPASPRCSSTMRAPWPKRLPSCGPTHGKQPFPGRSGEGLAFTATTNRSVRPP